MHPRPIFQACFQIRANVCRPVLRTNTCWPTFPTNSNLILSGKRFASDSANDWRIAMDQLRAEWAAKHKTMHVEIQALKADIAVLNAKCAALDSDLQQVFLSTVIPLHEAVLIKQVPKILEIWKDHNEDYQSGEEKVMRNKSYQRVMKPLHRPKEVNNGYDCL